MTIFKHLALAALCHADTFYTDPSKIDREAISEFRNLFERNFCSGNQSAPCQDEGGDKVCANDGWTYSSACDFKRNYCLGRRSLRFHHWGQCGKINDFVNDFKVSEVPATTKCVKSCTKDFRWVCGTDGESYPNMCHLEISTCKSDGEVQFASDGKCAINRDERPTNDNDGPDYEDEPEINLCDAKCPARGYSPHCGSDGVTYSSLCEFECVQNESGITLKHHGKCRDMVNDSKANRFPGRFPVATEEEKEEICKRCLTKEIRYVCGTNGKTYNTECELNYDRCQFGVDVSREHYGPCADDKSSLMLGDLINNFLEESAKGKADEAKEEIETCENLKTCSPEKNPVCGEFRDVLIPYINTCYMKMFSCKLAGNLYSIRARGKPKRNTCKSNGRNKRSDDGFCLSKIGCPRMMQGMSNKGVCGSDGITYWNECDLKRANCESDVEISLVYNDRCEAECALNSMDINMQCGTNGLTYWNMCALKEFNYLNRATDPYAESISVAYPGPCSVTNVQMLNDFPIDKKPVQKEVEEQEYKYDEEEDSEDMSPYSEVNCRSRKEEHYDQPCNSFDHKSCYSDGKKYSLCQFRLAKCDDSNLVLAIDPQSCETY